jgi:hypothetical protein
MVRTTRAGRHAPDVVQKLNDAGNAARKSHEIVENILAEGGSCSAAPAKPSPRG